MPVIVLGGMMIAFGLWIASQSRGGGVVTRTPPPVAVPQPQPQPSAPPMMAPPVLAPPAPATPGVSPGITSAMQTAEAIARTPLPQGSIVTSEQTGPSQPHVSLTVSPPGGGRSGPQRPPAPIRTPAQVIAASADPSTVEGDAHGMLEALQQHGWSEAERTEVIRRFQSAYGQGLTADGVYGIHTRHALASILGVPIAQLPAPTN